MTAFDPQRFIEAQEPVYRQALAELQAGQKRSHWMWFIFPQIEGLGHSAMAQHYALSDLAAARLYLDHPVLGQRLRECTAAVLSHAPAKSVEQMLGYPDNLKFHSSVTLFGRAAPEEKCFAQALDAFFGGVEDPGTLARL